MFVVVLALWTGAHGLVPTLPPLLDLLHRERARLSSWWWAPVLLVVPDMLVGALVAAASSGGATLANPDPPPYAAVGALITPLLLLPLAMGWMGGMLAAVRGLTPGGPAPRRHRGRGRLVVASLWVALVALGSVPWAWPRLLGVPAVATWIWLWAFDRDGPARLSNARRQAAGALGVGLLTGAWAPFAVRAITTGPPPEGWPGTPFVPVAFGVLAQGLLSFWLTRPWPWWTLPLALLPWALALAGFALLG